MARVTYSDLLIKMKGFISELEEAEVNLKKILGDTYQVGIDISTPITFGKVLKDKYLLSQYNVSAQDIIEIEQLLSFVSYNQKQAPVFYKKYSEKSTLTHNIASDCNIYIKEEKISTPKIYGIGENNLSKFLYQEEFKLKTLELTPINMNKEGLYSLLSKPAFELTDLNVLKEIDVSASLLCINESFLIQDLNALFEKHSILMRKILVTKQVEEKEFLKPRTNYRSNTLSLQDKEINLLRNSLLAAKLSMNESTKNEEDLKIFEKLKDRLDYSTKSPIFKEIKSTILFEEEDVFKAFLENEKMINNHNSVSGITNNYKNMMDEVKHIHNNTTNYLTRIYSNDLENSIVDFYKKEKDKEHPDFVRAIQRYKKYMLKNLLIAKDQPSDKVSFLNLVESIFEKEQIEQISQKFPEVFLKEESKDWFSFEYDSSMMSFTIDSNYFLLNKVDIISSRMRDLLNVWKLTNTENLPKNIIFDINKDKIFAYAKQQNKFLSLTEKQKNNVIISVFDAIVAIINDEDNIVAQKENMKVVLEGQLREISTLIALKNVKKDDDIVKDKKKI